MGHWWNEAIHFLDMLGEKMTLKSNDGRRMRLSIQRGNAAVGMGSFRSGVRMEEIFYLL